MRLRPLCSIGQARTVVSSPTAGRRRISPVIVPRSPAPPPPTAQATDPGQSRAAQTTSGGARPSSPANSGRTVQGPATKPAAPPSTWPVKTRRPNPSASWSPQVKQTGWKRRSRPGKRRPAAATRSRGGGAGASRQAGGVRRPRLADQRPVLAGEAHDAVGLGELERRIQGNGGRAAPPSPARRCAPPEGRTHSRRCRNWAARETGSRSRRMTTNGSPCGAWRRAIRRSSGGGSLTHG